MKQQLLAIVGFVVLLACSGQQAEQRSSYVADALACLDRQDYRGAEHIAYAAALSAGDTVEMREAVSLLSFVYVLEQKDAEAHLLMEVVPPESMARFIRLQEQQGRDERSRQRWLFAGVVVALAVAAGIAAWWHRRRTSRMNAEFQTKLQELEQLRSLDVGQLKGLEVDAAKLGVDVLYAILHDENISQMGRREQQAVMETVHAVDPPLATQLMQVPLTPKETFFVIMEHYGKTDAQKARCFCCSEQAIRSTKSRLGKKLGEIKKLRD